MSRACGWKCPAAYPDGMGVTGNLAAATTELSVVLILLCVIVVPIAAIAFARSGRGYAEIGKGRFAVDFDDGQDESGHEELRQLVEAKAYRQQQRGEQPVDVESEIDRLLAGELPESGTEPAPASADPGSGETDPGQAAIREEIRQVVVAGNERRERRGEAPLDVETEIDRMLKEFG